MASSRRGGEIEAESHARRALHGSPRRAAHDRRLADTGTPYGCIGFGTSTITVSIMGRSLATGMR
jgi:hypothetical protein